MFDTGKKRCLVIILFGTLLLCIGLSPAHAFKINDGPGWAAGRAPFYTTPTSITGSHGLTSAQLRTAFEAAMDAWTNNTVFNYDKDRGSVDGINICPTLSQLSVINPANNDNGFGFALSPCSGSFQGSTIAVATTWRSGSSGDGPLLQSGIIFNSSTNWNIYSGSRMPGSDIDFRRVAAHELGHSLGLAHSNTDQALMWPTAGNIELPQRDDIRGVSAIYSRFLVPPLLFLLLD